MQNAFKTYAVLASCAVAACGGGETADQTEVTAAPELIEAVSAEMEPVDWQRPCGLVEAGDLDAVFPDVRFDAQDHFEDHMDSDGTALGTCVYNARAFRAEDAYEVTVTLAAWAQDTAAYEEFASLTAEEVEGVEHLDGIAEAAAYLVHNGEPVTAFMHEGTMIEISVKHDARATFDGHDPSIALARQVAKRL